MVISSLGLRLRVGLSPVPPLEGAGSLHQFKSRRNSVISCFWSMMGIGSTGCDADSGHEWRLAVSIMEDNQNDKGTLNN
jgi:hypothetical protein